MLPKTAKDTKDSQSRLDFFLMNSLLNKFGLKNVNPVTTPLDPNVNLDDNEAEEDSNIQDN